MDIRRTWVPIPLFILVFILIPSCTTTPITIKPAEFTVNKLVANPVEVSPNQAVTVSADIGNIGGLADNYSAILTVDGKEKDRQAILIQPSENKTITFILTESSVGKHEVSLGSEKVFFTIANSRKIVFDHYGDLVSMNLDGSERVRTVYMADRSPDGNTIVFVDTTAFRNTWLYFKNADGTNIRPVFPIRGSGPYYEHPAWSPDGKKIAFCKSGTNAMGYNQGDSYVKVYYNIWIMDCDGSNQRLLSDISAQGTISFVNPVWFPDSQKIAYATNISGVWEICCTPIEHFEQSLILRLNSRDSLSRGYKISSDGKKMIYDLYENGSQKTIYIDLNTKAIVEWENVFTLGNPEIKSRDGTVKVFTKSDGLYYIDVEHKDPVKIPGTVEGDIAIRLE
jgi:hypothetical protein